MKRVAALLPPPFPMVCVAALMPGCGDADAGATAVTQLQHLAAMMPMKGRQWGPDCSARLWPCRCRGGAGERPPPSAPYLCNAGIDPPPHGRAQLSVPAPTSDDERGDRRRSVTRSASTPRSWNCNCLLGMLLWR
jgi:hypothetical protein